MKQARIMALLTTAAQSVNKDLHREILDELLEAMTLDLTVPFPNNPEFELLVTELYWKTLRENPDYLPKLFPVYAMLCGDKPTPTSLLSDVINWDLVKEL